jgi:O-antigen ligase
MLNAFLFLGVIIFSSFNILPLIVLPFIGTVLIGSLTLLRDFLSNKITKEILFLPGILFVVFSFMNIFYAYIIGVNIFNKLLYRHEFKFIVPYLSFFFFSILSYKKLFEFKIKNTLILLSLMSFFWFVFSLMDDGFRNMFLYPYLGTIWERYGNESIYLGPYQTHNSAGGFYAVLSLMLLGILKVETSKIQSRLIFLSLFAVLVCFFFTNSRAYELSLFIIAVILLLTTVKKNNIRTYLGSHLPYSVALLMILSVTALSATRTHLYLIPDYLSSKNSNSKNSNQYKFNNVAGLRRHNINIRLTLWKIALEDFFKSPIVGVGASRFDTDVNVINTIPIVTRKSVNPELLDTSGIRNKYVSGYLYRINISNSHIHTEQEVHNAYLQVLAEGGLLFFSMFITMFCLVFFKISRIIGSNRLQNSSVTGLALGAKNSLGCLFISSCFGSHLLGVIPLTFVLAITAYVFSFDRERFTSESTEEMLSIKK